MTELVHLTQTDPDSTPGPILMPNRSFGFLLIDRYPALPVAGMIDLLRDAEYVTERKSHSWFTIGVDRREVVAMNGMTTLTDYTLADAPPCDVVVVCSGLGGHLFDHSGATSWLRARNAENRMIGAIATGTWLLAKAGLLENRRCTLHWEDIQAFEETYPLLDVARTLYVRDGPIFTCSGGTAAIDLFLQFLTESLGPEVTSDVSRQILYSTVRVGSDLAPIKDGSHRAIDNKVVRRAAQLMHDNLENPLSISEIARQSHISQKQLERLFRDIFDTTPQLYYRAVRLDHARALVRLTKLEMWEIAVIVGFSTPQYLARCYRDRFGMSPSEERKSPLHYSIPPIPDQTQPEYDE